MRASICTIFALLLMPAAAQAGCLNLPNLTSCTTANGTNTTTNHVGGQEEGMTMTTTSNPRTGATTSSNTVELGQPQGYAAYGGGYGGGYGTTGAGLWATPAAVPGVGVAAAGYGGAGAYGGTGLTPGYTSTYSCSAQGCTQPQ